MERGSTADEGFPVAARTLAGVVGLIGLALLVAGAMLLRVGGSPWYALAGLATIASGVQTWRLRGSGWTVYAAMLLVTIAWSLWEAGLDGWALAPRLAMLVVIGGGFLLPPVSRRLSSARRLGGRPFAGGVVVAVLAGLALHAVGPADPVDPLYRTGIDAAWAAPAPAAASAPRGAEGDWLHYGNDAGGSRFSPLAQVTPANAAKLQVAWEVHVGDPSPTGKGAHIEATPLKVDDTVYVCTSYNDILALDAETGHQKWRYDPGVKPDHIPSGACRGVAYYAQPQATGACAGRVITNTVDGRLIAVDSRTGKPCEDFGEHGQVSLKTGMGAYEKGVYYTTSAPTLVHGKVVLGGMVLDGQYFGEPSGVIRAFDAVTGRFAWAFDAGRPDQHGQPGPGQQYTPDTPNSWAPMSADEALGLVFVPTGNTVPDAFGGQRRDFDDRISSSVVAIDVETGQPRWTFQTTHHDLWDYDVASQPTLVDMPTAEGMTPAVIQATKRGEIFVLDRRTGRPIRPVEERPVPQDGIVPEEHVSKTQPFSVGLPSFRGPRLRERDMWGVTPFDQAWCRIKFREARYEGTLTPPGLQAVISDPGYLGGVDWGGVSVDTDRRLMIVNSNRIPNYDQLITRAEGDRLGIKPGTDNHEGAGHGAVAQANTPYAGFVAPFLSPLGAPCNEPPYGRLTAVDLNNGKLVWTRVLGTARDSGPLGIPSHLPLPLGTPNIGGSVATRGGVVFIGATQESALRAVDSRTGETVWKARLPAPGQATPAVYWSKASQREFVVIAATGNILLGTALGDSIIAYALPRP